MHPLVGKLVRALGPARQEPLSAVIRKVIANVGALGWAATSLRACNAVGARARSFGRPRVENRGAIVIGDDFALNCAFGTVLLATAPTGRIDIGDCVTINYGSAITASNHVRLGNRVMVGPHCVIGDTEGLLLFEEDGAPIEIGDDVWLAGHVTVRPGARIGAGTVVAAGSVVEGDLPGNAVASGSPARVLRVRRPSEVPAPQSGVVATGSASAKEATSHGAHGSL
jgi:acetyltransferase-like isoleucine patch superfamily enzyme